MNFTSILMIATARILIKLAALSNEGHTLPYDSFKLNVYNGTVSLIDGDMGYGFVTLASFDTDEKCYEWLSDGRKCSRSINKSIMVGLQEWGVSRSILTNDEFEPVLEAAIESEIITTDEADLLFNLLEGVVNMPEHKYVPLIKSFNKRVEHLLPAGYSATNQYDMTYTINYDDNGDMFVTMTRS